MNSQDKGQKSSNSKEIEIKKVMSKTNSKNSNNNYEEESQKSKNNQNKKKPKLKIKQKEEQKSNKSNERENNSNNQNSKLEEEHEYLDTFPMKKNGQNIILMSTENAGSIGNQFKNESIDRRLQTSVKNDRKKRIKIIVRKALPKKHEEIIDDGKHKKENKGEEIDFDGISEEEVNFVKQGGKYLIEDKDQKLKIKESELLYKLKKLKEGVDVDDVEKKVREKEKEEKEREEKERKEKEE